MQKTTMVVALAGLAMSCAQPGTSDVDRDLGKADDSDGPAVVVEATDEAFWSERLRESICAEIASNHDWRSIADRTAFADGCQDHDFRLTEKTTSTLYGHLDAGPITLGMKVRVIAGDEEWNAVLTRDFGADYRFRWSTTVPDASRDRKAYIRQLAEDMGEYFDPGDAPDRLRVTSWDATPDTVRAAADRFVERWNAESQAAGRDDTAEYADEPPYEILGEDGEVVGYVVQIWYNIDDVLFDGGGTTMYLDLLGDEVVDVEWWG
jgi:hypothetical protein